MRTKVRRSGYDVYDIPVLKDIGGSAERSGCYTVVAGAPQQTVYHEFRMRYPWKKPFAASGYALDGGACYSSSPPRDDASVWVGSDWEKSGWHPYRNSRGEIISWYRYHIGDIHERDYRGSWQEQLPPGARPVLLTAEQRTAHPLLKGERCQGQIFVRERSEPHTDTVRALYAYPLAGVLWLGLDAPATVLGHLPFAPLLPWMYPVD